MPPNASIEQRLAALENAIAAIQRQLVNGTATVNWIDRFKGAFKDEPAFEEVIEYGREFRAAGRP